MAGGRDRRAAETAIVRVIGKPEAVREVIEAIDGSHRVAVASVGRPYDARGGCERVYVEVRIP